MTDAYWRARRYVEEAALKTAGLTREEYMARPIRNPKVTNMTTPLEREILTHYWTTQGPPFRGGPATWSDSVGGVMDGLIALGVLVREADGTVRGNEAALKVYMEALAAVPLPVQKWVIEDGE